MIDAKGKLPLLAKRGEGWGVHQLQPLISD